MIQFVKRNAFNIWLTILIIFSVGGVSVIGIAIANSSPSENHKIGTTYDRQVMEPGPGVGMNGKFNLNPFGLAPGL
jgi:hypothetical protein